MKPAATNSDIWIMQQNFPMSPLENVTALSFYQQHLQKWLDKYTSLTCHWRTQKDECFSSSSATFSILFSCIALSWFYVIYLGVLWRFSPQCVKYLSIVPDAEQLIGRRNPVRVGVLGIPKDGVGQPDQADHIAGWTRNGEKERERTRWDFTAADFLQTSVKCMSRPPFSIGG